MQEKQSDIHYDLLIVGFGPVGMLAANLMGMYGFKVAVFERNQQLYDLPRAIHIDDETMRILQYVGLHQEVLGICKSVPGMQLIDKRGKVLLETSKVPTAGFAASYLFYQPDLEQILVKGIHRFPEVSVFWGANVQNIVHHSDSVRISVAHEGGVLTYQGKYVLACDGANSGIRQLLNLPLKDFKFSRRNLKTDVLLKEEMALPPWIQKTCEPRKQSMVFLNSFGNHCRWEFSLPQNDKAGPEYWEDPATVQQLLSLVIDPTKVILKHVAVYQFATKIATQWQKNQVFLAGDAAHQMPPYIGQGMCAGFRDIQNLGWKLQLVLQNKATPDILKSYSVERIPHVRFIMFVTRWVGRLFISQWTLVIKGLAWFVPARWRKVQVPPQKLKTGLFGKNRRLRGHLMPQMEVRQGSESLLLDECLGLGFSLIAYASAPLDKLSSEVLLYFKSLNGQLFILSENDTVLNNQLSLIIDSQQYYKRWFKKHRVDFVILRPDRYIYDAARAPNLSQVLQKLKKDFTITGFHQE